MKDVYICRKTFLAEKRTNRNVVIPDEYVCAKRGERFILDSGTENYDIVKSIDIIGKRIVVTPYDFYACFDKEGGDRKATNHNYPRIVAKVPESLSQQLFYDEDEPEDDEVSNELIERALKEHPELLEIENIDFC